MDGTIPRTVGLSYTRVKHGQRNKSVGSIYQVPALSFCLGFSQWTVIWDMKAKQTLSFQVVLDMVFYHSKAITKTVSLYTISLTPDCLARDGLGYR